MLVSSHDNLLDIERDKETDKSRVIENVVKDKLTADAAFTKLTSIHNLPVQ